MINKDIVSSNILLKYVIYLIESHTFYEILCSFILLKIFIDVFYQQIHYFKYSSLHIYIFLVMLNIFSQKNTNYQMSISYIILPVLFILKSYIFWIIYFYYILWIYLDICSNILLLVVLLEDLCNCSNIIPSSFYFWKFYILRCGLSSSVIFCLL